MASLGHPRRYETQEGLDSVHRLLGWSTPELAGRIREGSLPLGDLHPGKFVLFVLHMLAGLALPISPFFLLLLEEFGLQLQHLTPHCTTDTSFRGRRRGVFTSAVDTAGSFSTHYFRC